MKAEIKGKNLLVYCDFGKEVEMFTVLKLKFN